MKRILAVWNKIGYGTLTERFVVPITMEPASLRRIASAESSFASSPSKARDPPVVGSFSDGAQN